MSSVEKSESVTVTVSTANYSDITINLVVTATVKTPVEITGVVAQNGVYTGKAHSGYSGTPIAGAYKGDLAISYNSGSEPVNAGDYTVTIAIPDDNESYIGSVTLAFQIEQATITVKADDKTATVGGSKPELTATVSGLADGEQLKTPPTLACDADMARAGSYEIIASGAEVPDGGNYKGEIVYQPGTLTISGSNAGGGSTSGSTSKDTTTVTKNPDGSTTTKTENTITGTVTETTQNTDGSQTTVETKKDGTVTTTEMDKDGNKTQIVAKPDGSNTTTVEQKDGTTANVTTDTSGKTEAVVVLSAEVVSDAQQSAQAVTLPIPEVRATKNTETAPVVTVNTGSNIPVKVEIPTSSPSSGTVAMIVNADGTEEVIKSSVPTETGLAVALPDGAVVKIVDNSKSFADVPADSWAVDAITFSSARELFSGTGVDRFSPDEPMTRAMLMTVLARFDGTDTSGGDTWYEKGMNWAVDKGVSDGSAPDGNISREQLAVMLWRYSGSPASSGALDRFTDGDFVSGYAQEAMRWAVENGVINGDNGKLSPQGQATRAQVAQMLKNFIEA